ncbi:FAD-dependent thymidylate synthase [Candidatus Cardinium hertigii]|uniref:Flavin-dependent thymidylate synthase n=1 Tax=Candidatus Cardinium hertigii TaxID=247481 RepID=A0A2Z3LHC6_9BACT|nr:FAD-dependent thymidylate synthase [Candidatus Cardinium hertigii]AWN81915.1 Flavin-dependent thymidylate synthase [Candidatus Cardinium hertigii]
MTDERYSTRRTTVKEIDDLLYEEYKVLDHGFIRVVDYMGSDSSIVQAARVSYGKGTKQISQDEALINYLMRHAHTTPFEMCEIKFHVKLPIFVARQWIRHRTANVNEYSARYSILDNEFYIPQPEHIAKQSSSNNQGSGTVFDKVTAKEIANTLKNDAQLVYAHYKKFIEQELARETARTNLTINYYTQLYWKIDLHNLLHFLKLRADRHAQYEIRVYAEKMLELVQKWVPLTYKSFVEYQLESICLSKKGLAVVRKLTEGKKISKEESGLSQREWNELMLVLGKPTG